MFPSGCFRQILAELGTHCPRITILHLGSSKGVDDFSVIHLLKVKSFVYLNIIATSIIPKAYVYYG
jgi:hypothetical protein